MDLGKRAGLAALGGLVATLLAACQPESQIAQQVDNDVTPRAQCTVIDTDFDIDDMMAIPIVIGNRHVAAIITSEGYTRAEAGAAALARLIAEPGQRAIPVIAGANSDRDPADIAKTWPWLQYFRNAMNRANNFLAVAPPVAATKPDFVEALVAATASCKTIDFVMIGSYSSFAKYSPALSNKISHVVSMGKPIGDPAQRPGNFSFNCEYDMPACELATRQIKSYKGIWVDVPRNKPVRYEPSLAMVEGLKDAGLPGTLKAALLGKRDTWDPVKVAKEAGGPGGLSLLWDQSASLYLLHPEAFVPVGGHFEPRLIGESDEATLAGMRRMWTDDTNRAVTYK
ncbi:nucleoside hydrolase [Prosthecodimorpha staleyi]|uniref:Nucleoside hydrolase n=1 Tax=Prosthecodimorpha staleyi TaxID=2840188 RepID=A0A947D2S9_9HYPH|nr:nucleoside hydrolase [Prosthecodimorpha staleyi]MBT9289935.1 nucleoside hydrolase [Prosthecodimorpha staleyi]